MRILVTLLLIVVCILPTGAQDSALPEVVAANADLSTLFTLISAANLLETLSDPASEFTLFAPSNAAFDASLKTRDPRMGIRDFEAVNRLAAAVGLKLVADVAMPANNRTLVWWRV